nr:DnaT-like ssDNA-binding domain-containing protein [Kushneria phosphatilytica]
MLVEIDSLQHPDRGCFKSNSKLAEFFGLSASRVSEIISSLARKGFISIKTIRDGKRIVERRIYMADPFEKPNGGTRNPEEGIQDSEGGIRNPEEGYSGSQEERGSGFRGSVENSLSDASAADADQSGSADIFDRAQQLDDSGDQLTTGARQFRMTLDWQPDSALWQAECQRRGLSSDTGYSASELADFTAHHTDTGRRYGNHAWTSKFVRWVQENRKRESARQSQKPANNQTSGGSHAPRSQRPRQYQSAAEARRAAESGGQPVGETFDGDWAPGHG